MFPAIAGPVPCLFCMGTGRRGLLVPSRAMAATRCRSEVAAWGPIPRSAWPLAAPAFPPGSPAGQSCVWQASERVAAVPRAGGPRCWGNSAVRRCLHRRPRLARWSARSPQQASIRSRSAYSPASARGADAQAEGKAQVSPQRDRIAAGSLDWPFANAPQSVAEGIEVIGTIVEIIRLRCSWPGINRPLQ